MPRNNAEHPVGSLYLVTESRDYDRARVIPIDGQLLGETDASDYMKRIADTQVEQDFSHVTLEDAREMVEMVNGGVVGEEVRFTTPWGMKPSGVRLGPSYKVEKKSHNSWEIKSPKTDKGHFVWCGERDRFDYDQIELRHVFPERLSKQGLEKAISKYREEVNRLPDDALRREAAFFDAMPEVDTSRPVDLFEGVQVSDTGDGIRYTVPPRRVRSERFGDLELRVSGRHEWFKSRWEYGTARFVSHSDPDGAGDWRDMKYSGHWLPHAFVMEDINPTTGLPEIPDQERVSVRVWIGNPYRRLQPELDHGEVVLGLNTIHGKYDLLPDMEMQPSQATHVSYAEAMLNGQANPQQLLSLGELGEINGASSDESQYADYGYVLARPLRYTPRVIWVPVAALRSGGPKVHIDLDALMNPRPDESVDSV